MTAKSPQLLVHPIKWLFGLKSPRRPASVDPDVRLTQDYQDKITPSTRVFGVALELLPQEMLDPDQLIPKPLFDCIRFLNETALCEQGLYRVPGSRLRVNLLKAKYDSGTAVNLFEGPEAPETAVSLILAYIREVPDTVFSRSGGDRLRAVQKQDSETAILREIQEILNDLPPPYWRCLNAFCAHLAKVEANQAINLMSATNLALCIFPLLRNNLVAVRLISYHKLLFSSNPIPEEVDEILFIPTKLPHRSSRLTSALSSLRLRMSRKSIVTNAAKSSQSRSSNAMSISAKKSSRSTVDVLTNTTASRHERSISSPTIVRHPTTVSNPKLVVSIPKGSLSAEGVLLGSCREALLAPDPPKEDEWIPTPPQDVQTSSFMSVSQS